MFTRSSRVWRTNALEPGLGPFPSCSERLVLGLPTTHADLDGCRYERTVAEACWRVIAGGRGTVSGRRDRLGGGGGGSGRLIGDGTHVCNAYKPNCRRTLGILDEVDSRVNVL